MSEKIYTQADLDEAVAKAVAEAEARHVDEMQAGIAAAVARATRGPALTAGYDAAEAEKSAAARQKALDAEEKAREKAKAKEKA